jgi:hypothetical protein
VVREDDDPVAPPVELAGDRAAHETRAAGYRHGTAGRRQIWRLEDRLESASPKPEDRLELGANRQAVGEVAERAERQLVRDLVVHERSALEGLERVPVGP